MNEIINITQGHALTMSSLEIAGLASKRHKNVLADIRKMVDELGLNWAEFSAEYKDATGRTLVCARLPKRETLILVSGYSVQMRARIIDRWQELENVIAEAAGTISTMPPEIVEYIRRTDGISRMLSHKVTEIEKAMHDMVLADGVTAGEVCDLAKVATSYPRGLSGRVSRRLSLFCSRNGEKPRISRLGRVRAQLFPTHLVREWLDIEGRALIRAWIEEKKGQQTKLRLIGGGAS